MRKSGFQFKTLTQRCAVGVLFCFGFATSQAGTSSGQFSVNITVTGVGKNLNQQSAPGVCTSQTLSDRTNSIVRVVCATGQFVSITANPNARFLGTHGGAFRYVLSPATIYSSSQSIDQGNLLDFYPGSGTVTAWRVYNVDGSEKLLEVLLTF